ncbi:MAG: ABC transporter substrate-binding protein [Streptosporangiaceae bacterium]
MKKIRLALPALAAVAALTAAGCSSSGAPSTNTSGGSKASTSSATLTVVIGNGIDTLDPAAQATASVMAIEDMIVQELTSLSQSGAAQPLLATSWTEASNGLSWTFNLRHGVKFSDGTPFNAAAVKFNIDRMLSPKTYKADPNVFVVIKDVDVLSQYQVRIDLKSPFPALPIALSLPIAGIISPASATKSPNTVEEIKVPVGTGPYKYSSYVPNDHITMVANPDYWGTKPYFGTQTYRFVADAATGYALFQSGQAQVVASLPQTSLTQLQSNSQLLETDSSYAIQMQFDSQDKSVPALQNAKVRQALSWAVDRPLIISKILDGAGKQLQGPFPLTDPGACVTGNYGYDPAKAKAMLKAAGVRHLTLKMASPEGRYPQDYQVAQAIAGELRAIGITVTLTNPTNFASYLDQVMVTPSKATSDLHLLGWGSLYGDASQALLQFQTIQMPPAGYDGSYFTNKQYDADVNKGNSALTDSVRFADYCTAEKVLMQEAPVIWLYQEENPVAVATSIKGVYGLPVGFLVTTYAKQG